MSALPQLVWPWLGAPVLLGALALMAERVPRARGLAEGLWWAALARLVLPPWIASPVGFAPPWTVGGSGLFPGSGPPPGSGAAGDVEAGEATLLIAGWMIGACLAGTAALRSWRDARLAWRRADATPPRPRTAEAAGRAAAALGLRRTPAVGVLDAPPACVGALVPWIAVPPELERPERARDLEVVLLHECAHVARRDGLRRALLAVLSTVFWFHPVPHLARRRLAAFAEFACDRAAAERASGGVAACREALARTALGDSAPPLALGFRPRPSLLDARLRALLFNACPGPSARLAAPAGFALALASIGAARGAPPDDAQRAAAPMAAVHPPLESLEGCLQKRYAVLAALAQSTSAAEAAPKR